MRKPSWWSAVAVALACIGLEVRAHSPIGKDEGNDLAALVERSNLVFVGRAARVEYRVLRTENKEEGPIPHTFVTYRVERVLRGESPGQEITLRVVGGPDGRGRFLTVNGVPIIQEGDHDLLFVDNAEDPSCPLVHCENGRFRILGERIYDTHGAPVRAIAKNKVVSRGRAPEEFRRFRFPAPAFDELIQNPEVAARLKEQQMPIEEARRRYALEAPKQIVLTHEISAAPATPDGGDRARPSPQAREAAPLTLPQFLAATENVARTARRKAVRVRGADPRSPVAAARLSVVTPGVPPAPSAIRHGSKADEEEYNALAANKFDPVIRKNQ